MIRGRESAFPFRLPSLSLHCQQTVSTLDENNAIKSNFTAIDDAPDAMSRRCRTPRCHCRSIRGQPCGSTIDLCPVVRLSPFPAIGRGFDFSSFSFKPQTTLFILKMVVIYFPPNIRYGENTAEGASTGWYVWGM